MRIKNKIYGKINSFVQKSNWYNEVAFPDCKKFWKHRTFNLDVVNLGSTSGLHAFNYEGIQLKAANWALSHNPILADKEVLKNYFSYLNPQKSTVIVNLCPFTSLSGSSVFFEDRYYTILKLSSIPYGLFRKKLEVMRKMTNPMEFYPMYEMLRNFTGMFKRKKDKIYSEEKMTSDAQRWMNNWKKEFSITDFSYPLSLVNRDGIEDAAKILNEIISFCKTRNIRPVIVIPPVYHTLGALFTPEIRKVLISSLIEKIEDTSIWFHNYMDDPDFNHSITYFRNSYLLNKKGAKSFTKKVLQDINLLS